MRYKKIAIIFLVFALIAPTPKAQAVDPVFIVFGYFGLFGGAFLLGGYIAGKIGYTIGHGAYNYFSNNTVKVKKIQKVKKPKLESNCSKLKDQNKLCEVV